jgi:phosphate transport system substrate-binding protein
MKSQRSCPRRIAILTLGLALILSVHTFVSDTPAQQEGKTILKVNGAGMASDYIDRWSKVFMQDNADCSITVIGSSAGKGFQALIDGRAEIAMMSRAISATERTKAAEKGVKIVEKPIARAALALITHPRNPVNELTLEQVHKLYSGVYQNWKDVGGPDQPVRCLSRRIPESGGAVFFWRTVLHEDAFGKNVLLTETWESILKVCTAATDYPVGIVPSTRNLKSVKVLAIKKDDASPALLPSEENLKNASYPITLKFFFAWDQRTETPLLPKFAEFCQTQGGR